MSLVAFGTSQHMFLSRKKQKYARSLDLFGQSKWIQNNRLNFYKMIFFQQFYNCKASLKSVNVGKASRIGNFTDPFSQTVWKHLIFPYVQFF